MPVLPDPPAAETAIIELTNAFRATQKLAPVRQNPTLAAAARAYAKKLIAFQGLSHTADGTTPAQRVTSAGYSYCELSENLASILARRSLTTDEYARRTVTGWENSPGHRKNMLLPHVTETGVGVVRVSPNEPKYIAVQLFARPEAAKYSFKIRNEAPSTIAYRFNDTPNTVSPRQIITHTTCLPGTIAFETTDAPNVKARYETRAGQVYSLKPTSTGVTVEVNGQSIGRD
ncbi:CAP domain-containing protein [Hyphomicrobium sp. 1Nfss2.1]|uniref:CAP domain-containing protein n=1 Tax=Hyphomicrobium sp. 1Nfss2.1 TaxID=3413936 RepID=UPI003C7A6FD3